MKKVSKRLVMLAASLLMMNAIYATINVGGAVTAENGGGCDRGSSTRIYSCNTDNPLDAGCGDGTAESCAEIKGCP
jgi:hypothetical protein